MKRLFLFITVLSLSSSLSAQMNTRGLQSPVKLSDVQDYYTKYVQPYVHTEEQENEHRSDKRASKESTGRDYQFNRWKWYWKQHLDNNGYIISPMKTYHEWLKYNAVHSAERTTGTSSGANWVFKGDDSSGAGGSGVGRINNIAFHPTDSNTYWAGSPGGGAWKTTNNGLKWTCMTDKLPLLSVTQIVINPKNANTIYLCTGDGDGQDYSSLGVLKSYNGGLTWDTTGFTWNEYQYHFANSLLINPKDTNALTLATDTGIYKSFNGGKTWAQVVSSGVYTQLLYHPADTNIMYATTYYNRATSTQGQIYRSADGGMTWTQETTFTDAERIALAVSPANVSVVKALVSASDATNVDGLSGIWSSSDTGQTFTEVFTGGCSGSKNLLSFNADGTGCGGQGFYDLTIALSPVNVSDVYVGGVNSWRSTNGGTSWKIMNQWDSTLSGVVAIHADKHFMGFNPLLPNRFFESNDGGVYWSDNVSATSVWNNVTNGIGVTEFYRMAVSNSATYQIGGAQDVGSKMIQNKFYQDVDGGDGTACQIDYADTTTYYTTIETGTLDYQNIVTGAYVDIASNIAGGSVEGNGGWVTPFILEPTCHTCIITGYQDVYRTTDQGNTWTDISGALTSTDILRVETTEADSNTIYAADDGTNNIFYTHDMGATSWTTLTAPYTGQYISDLITDPRDANQIWVAFSSYTDYGSPQIVSYNPKSGWVSFNTNLPDVPVNCLFLDKLNRTMYAGTETGVYYRDTTMTQWEPFTTGMPVVGVYDLQMDYTHSKIWAATFGRSMWSSAKHIVTTTRVNNISSEKDITIVPNPNHGSFTITLNGNTTVNKVSLKLFDNSGKPVWQGGSPVGANNNVQVNTKELAPGVYMLEIEAASGVIGQKKIVIY